MTPAEINDLANILVMTSVVPTLGYTATYGFASPWYKSPLGVVMFGVGLSLTMVLGIVIGRRLFGTYPGYEWVALAGYTLVTITMWALWIIVIIERRSETMLQFPLSREKRHPERKTP